MEHRGDRAQQAFGLTQRLMKYQAQREAGLDGDRRIDRLATAFNAASYAGQFVTRYLAFGILWRRLSLYL